MRKVFNSKYLIFFLLIVLGTFLFFKPPADPDFGWHFRYGEHLFKEGSLLKDNTFSYTYSDYKWANSYWISEYIFYVTHNFLGSVAPTLVLSLILSIFILLLITKHTKNILNISIVYISIVVFLQAYSIPVRPLYYSTIFLIIFLYILLYKQRWIKYLPVLFLIWANTHADFFVALFIFGVYSLSVLAKKLGVDNFKTLFKIVSLKSNISIRKFFSSFLFSFKYFLLSLLFTLINPYGIGLWTTLLNELVSPAKFLVAEFSNIEMSFKNTFGIYYSVVLAVGFLSELLIFNRKDKLYNWWYFFLISFFYLFSARSVYFARTYLTLASLSMTKGIGSVIEDISTFLNKRTVKVPRAFLIIFVLLVLMTSFPNLIKNIQNSKSLEKWSKDSKYPYGAIKYVRENPIKGNVFNLYGWGGYMIWQLPEYKTFIDGRMATWNKDGEHFLKDTLLVTNETEKNISIFNKYVSDYNITWVLDKQGSDLVKYLTNLGENSWKTYYEDDVSVILLKQPLAN